MHRYISLLIFCLSIGSMIGFFACEPLSVCRIDDDCQTGQRCHKGNCQQGQGQINTPCTTQTDCQAGLCCAQSKCVQASQCQEIPTTEIPIEIPTEKAALPDTGPVETLPEQPSPDTTPTDTTPTKQVCVAGVSQFCIFPRSNQPNACTPGTRVCLPDQSGWSECKLGTIQEPTHWTHPGNQEAKCDVQDDNCNGLIDEGCPAPNQNALCLSTTRLSLIASQHHIAFASVRHLLSNEDLYTHNIKRSLYLYPDQAGKRWIIAKVNFNDEGFQTQDPTIVPQTQLPEIPGVRRVGISIDGSWMALATIEKLFLIKLTYDSKEQPQIEAFSTFPVKNIWSLSFVGDGQDLLIGQWDEKQILLPFELSVWRITQRAKGLELAMQKKIALPSDAGPINSVNLYGMDTSHDGTMFAIANLQEVLLYRIPQLQLINRTKLALPQENQYTFVLFHPTKSRLLIAPHNAGPTILYNIDTSNQAQVQLKQLYVVSPGVRDAGTFMVGFHPTTGDFYASTGPGGFLFHWKLPEQTPPSAPTQLASIAYKTAIQTSSTMALTSHIGGIMRAHSLTTGKQLHQWNVQEGATFPAIPRVSAIQHTMLLHYLGSKVQVWKINPNDMANPAPTQVQELTWTSVPPITTAGQSTLSDDGNTVIWMRENTAAIWQRTSKDTAFQRVRQFQAANTKANTMALHTTQPWLLITDAKELHLWSLDDVNKPLWSQTFTADLLNATFIVQGQETMILATTDQGVTQAFVIQSNGTITAKALSGSVQFSQGSQQIFGVQYHGPYIFHVVPVANTSESKLVQQAYSITLSPAGGTINAVGDVSELPNSNSVNLSAYDDSNKILYGTNLRAIYLWKCQ